MRYKQKGIEELVNGIKGKKNIFCFGAGTALINFLHEFQEYRLEDDIKYAVDNSREKQGTMVQGINGDIPVISLKQMLCEIEPEDVIIITTAHFREIEDMLNGEEKLKNTECYLYCALRIEIYDHDRLSIAIPKKFSMYREQQIPKTIHYCWFGGKPIPNQYKLWMESWKRYCPDYEIIEWNEDNYDVHKNRFLSQAYKLRKWAFVSDYARIDIINEYGGVYLDTDVELVKNIDVLLKNEAFCGFETDQYVNYGLGFGAIRHHPILNEIKRYYDNVSFVLENETLNQVTCPVVQTNVMKQYGLVCNGEFQVVDGMTVYPSSILCGMSPYSFRVQCNLKYTYAIHHFAGSWVDNQQGKEDTISCMKKWSNSDLFFYPD